MKHFAYFLLLLSFSSCARQELSVFKEYVSIETLPSYQIHTPDPRLFCPDVGERLHIKWNAKKYCSYDSLELKLQLQFGSGETQELWYDLNSIIGICVYSLLNEEYWAKEGVFTYKVELYGNQTLLDTWKHRLWTNRILFENKPI